MGLLGAKPLAGLVGPGGTTDARNTNLRMQAAFEPNKRGFGSWLNRRPGFRSNWRLGSWPAASGILGWCRSPPWRRQARKPRHPVSSFLWWSINRLSNILRRYAIAQKVEAGKAARIRISGATPQPFSTPCSTFWSGKEPSSAWMGKCTRWNPPRHWRCLWQDSHGQRSPRFKVRGLNPCRFPEQHGRGSTVRTFATYLEAMMRMRFNHLGMHVFSREAPYVDSFFF